MRITLEELTKILNEVGEYYSYDQVSSVQVTDEALERIKKANEGKNLIMVVPDLGCAYKWDTQWKQLAWCPLFANNVLDLDADEWGPVDEDIVGEEEVMVEGRTMTLSELYREVEFKLGATQ